ncbi:hypothetical protein CI105_02815 [Candidatus Izimaplasma bacterium ZiA1]|nr:hypothetical protein CI105_02815 [Candidatus Izimaplasma bacterium ZiA1]
MPVYNRIYKDIEEVVNVKTMKLKDGIYWIGSVDHELREFDVVLHAKYGTTYNSYLVKGSKKTAIIDTVKHTKIDDYLDKLKDLVDIKDVDYIIINHAEPDHTGSIKKLLELNKDIIVVGSRAALSNLKEITNMEFNEFAVSENKTLDLGDKVFKFISAPNLHWPDTIYSYLETDNVIFTCDSFGSHYGMDIPLQSKITNYEEYMDGFHYYFEKILLPFKSFMIRAINKIEKLDIDMVCTGHGPILDEDPWKIINYSKELSLVNKTNSIKEVVIPYVTSYGYTTVLVNKIKEVLENNKIKVSTYDMTYDDLDEVMLALKSCDGVLFGSPTILGDALFPLWQILIRLNPYEQGIKKASVFGSYGWSGEGIKHVDERLKQLKYKTIEPFKLKFQPSDDELVEVEKYALSFVELLNK